MKIIISHDVDHIDGWCHWYKDLYWEKFLIKAVLFYLQKRISFRMLVRRICYVFTRRIENVDELMQFDRVHGVKSTFFVGVNNALGMSYSCKTATKMIHHIAENGFDVGVHGCAFDHRDKVIAEYKKFSCLASAHPAGVRNHYLRGRESRAMHQWQSDAGYMYDSTDYGIAAPYKVGDMWEFPLSIMDAYVLNDYDNDLANVKQVTLRAIADAEDKHIPYFTLLFHNPSPVFPDGKVWYRWVVEYLREQGYEFISFKDAVRELECAR